MTREDIEKDTSIDSVGKLMIEWLSRRDLRVYTAQEVSAALGAHTSSLVDAAHQLRRKGMLSADFAEERLQSGSFLLSKAAYFAYQPVREAPAVVTAPKGKR